MSKSFTIFVFVIQLLISCNSSSEKNDVKLNEPNINKLDSITEIVKKDSASILSKDTITKKHDNTLELKKETEIEIVLSEECQEFIDDYSQLLDEYESLLKQLNEDNEDINLIIARNSLEEELESFSSDPTSFQCSNKNDKSVSLFNQELEKINSRKDALY